MVLTRFASLLVFVAACRPADAPELPPLVLHDTAGATVSLPGDLAQSRFTVAVFYADHCPCFRVHEERVRAIARDYAGQGVRLFVVDSEVTATAERDAKASAERALPPIVLDPGGKLAHAVGAEYATYAVVFDATGRIRYRGGIDDDKNVLHPDATHYLTDALDDLVAGNEPRRREGKALGCALQTQ